MTPSPKVTIGVPVYNGSEFLDEALSCICAQTYQDLEILVSDNASTDSTSDIINKWVAKDPRIKSFKQDEKLSGLEHFQWVINKATSKWFCYAAHDDLRSNNFIEELIKPLEETDGALVSVARQVLIDEHGNKMIERPYIAPQNNKNLRAIVKHNLKIVNSAWYYGVYERKFLIKVQNSRIYFKENWGIDFATFLCFIFENCIVGNNKAIFYQRVTDLSAQQYKPKKSRDIYVHYRDICKEVLYYLNKSKLTKMDKVSLLPSLYEYTKRVTRIKKIFTAFMKEKFLFKKDKEVLDVKSH